MKTLKITLFVIAVIVLAGVAMFGYYGGFHKVRFETATVGGDTLVYREMTGDYSLSGETMAEVYNVLKEDFNVQNAKKFGIYFDNPAKVAKEKLRYEAGCIISGADTAQLSAIGAKYLVRVLPVHEAVVSEFPYKGKASVIVSIMKVYPALTRWFEQNNMMDRFGPVMEIYDAPAGKIFYRVELLDAADTTAAPAPGTPDAPAAK